MTITNPAEPEARPRKMLRNPIGEEYQKYPVKVSGKILKQLSSGIYRTPANVVKELVSNSFDADAPAVLINLDYPNFGTFSCYDEGLGLTANEFSVRMQEIGGSVKRIDASMTHGGRPLIGRIGIGLLAIGQISTQFRVISGKHGDTEGFEAKVNLERFFAPGRESYRPLDELALGTVLIRKYEKNRTDHFTLIDVPKVGSVFHNRMAIPRNEEKGRHFPGFRSEKRSPFETFVAWASDFTSIKKLAGYDQFLWELAMQCPVRYPDAGPVQGVRSTVIDAIKRRLEGLRFSVLVDGVELKKPVLLPSDPVISRPDEDYGVYEIHLSTKVGERQIRATGYYYHQVRRITPAELRGILPRIRNVGIGMHSNNPFRLLEENPIAAFQLSGELYVDEGLDDALNIDRNSFFESDEAFIAIRDFLDDLLGKREEGILADVRRRQNRAQGSLRNESEARFRKRVLAIAHSAGLKGAELRVSRESRPVPLEIRPSSREIWIYNSPVLPRRKEMKRIALLYFACFELASTGVSNAEARREKFYELASQVFES